jgi:hypothetical protein
VVIWYSLFYFIICIFDVLTLTNQKGRNYQYINLKPSPECICGHGFEDCIHFLFECPKEKHGEIKCLKQRIKRRRKVSNKQRQQKTTWTGVSKLVY